MKLRCLALPMEILHREFPSKLLLALRAVQRGFRVVIGHSIPLHAVLQELPGGVYFDKSATHARSQRLARWRSLGWRTVASCEEGLVAVNAADYVDRRISAESLGGLDAFFTWGPWQHRTVVEAFPFAADKLVPSGHSRADVLSERFRRTFQPAADALRRRYGNFVLVNSNFGFYNAYKGGGGTLASLKAQGKIRTAAHEEFFEDWIEHKRALMESFVDAIPFLARAVPDMTIVVRPHPTESEAMWRNRVGGSQDIVVSSAGGAIAWMLAAAAVVQNSCTTGVEAALLGKPAISYMPVRDDRFDCFLPCAVTSRATTVDELVAAVQNAENPQPSPNGSSDILDVFLFNWRDASATDRIMDHIETLDAPVWTGALGLPERVRCFKALTHDRVRLSIESAKDVVRGRPSRLGYVQRKFPGLSAGLLASSITAFRSCDATLPDARVRWLASSVAVLDPAR